MGNILSNIPWNRFYATGFRARTALRVGGGAALGAGAGYVAGDHPLAGGVIGGLAGAAGHMAMKGRSLRWGAARGWQNMAKEGKATAEQAKAAIQRLKGVPNIF